MKKLWLAAVGLLALGMGAPASAADLDIGLVRLNYRFNGFGGFGAPFAARY